MTSSSIHPMLNIAIKAARAAGSVINRAALDIESVRISQKQVNDYVTEIDVQAEEAIIGTILEAYPEHSIWAEESGRTRGSKRSDFVWIIDPIDGTTNFIHGFPFYCVSIAMAFRGRIEQAVVFDPVRNDLFTATKGRGAYLNDRRLRVGKRIALKDCLVSTGFPQRPGDAQQRYLAMLGEVMPKVAGVRRPGAAALDLAYVAAGFADAFFEPGLSAWDVAAGSLLVQEAGGLVGNFTGEADFLEARECMAAGPKIYGLMIPLLTPFSKFAGVKDKLAVDAALKASAEPAPTAAPDAAAEAPTEAASETPKPRAKIVRKVPTGADAALQVLNKAAGRRGPPKDQPKSHPKGDDAPF